MSELDQYIGYVVGGGLKENLKVRLEVASHNVQEGAFVVIESGSWHFYGLVIDLQLGATDPRFADEQSPTRMTPGIVQLLQGQTLYTNIEVMPALMYEVGPDPSDEKAYQAWQEARGEADSRILPVKTIPPHHMKVRLANAGDIAEIFGKEGKGDNFVIGFTREQGHPVRIDLKKFVQRSAGIFGATGTGKSFLTRIVLAGLMHNNSASVLVFDMHNEYGFDDTASDTGEKVIGLRTKFPGRVRVVGLGRGSTIRNQNPDFNLEIATKDILPEDILLLTRTLNLRETTPTTLDALVSSFRGGDWFSAFKAMSHGQMVEDEDGKRVPHPDSVAYWANQTGTNVMAAEALHNKLRSLFNKDYIVEKPAADMLGEIVKALEARQHIVLSFGKFESDLDYLFVTNLLTRKIRARWEQSTNNFRGKGGSEPQPLVIALEEAHKLLNREMAAQTTFSTIARELRKYYVTLLIVDQRPSQIYDEVMSQLGTRISGWLGDDDDIRAVLSGLAGRDAIRGMLSRLQPKEEVILLGWGVPMPLPIRSRRYDDTFWNDLQGKNQSGSAFREEDTLKELGF